MSSQELSKIDEIEQQKAELYKSIAEWPLGCKYDVDKRIEVITLYAITGSLQRTANDSGVPITTLMYWKKNSPWWDEQLAWIRSEKLDQLDSSLEQIIEESTKQAKDRLENGDAHVLRTGEIVRKPISYRDVVTGMAISVDKLRLIRNQPTSISSSSQDAFAQVLNKLAEVGQNMHANTTKPAINVERVDTPKGKD